MLNDALELLAMSTAGARGPEGGGRAEGGDQAAGSHRRESRPAGGRRGPPAVTSRYPGPVERPDDEARRRRIGIALVVLAIALFIAELVALAFGLLEIAALIFLIFVGGWFALRSYQRRTGRA